MIITIIFSLFVILLSSIFFVYILTLLPPNVGRFKYGGVYSVTSSYYHVKYVLLLLFLKLKRWREKEKTVGQPKMYDLNEKRFFKKIEKLQSLDEKDSIDSVYFYCTGKMSGGPSEKCDGGNEHTIDIIVRLARRQNRVNENWMMIRMDNEPLLVHQSAPDTAVGNCALNGWTTLTGLSIYCDRPNEKWTVKYNGWLKHANPTDKPIHLDLKMSFTAFTNIFDSHKDTSLELASDAIARESWSREFFDQLKDFKEKKQTHYEQWGGYSGRITFGRTDKFELRQCKGYRDHSFGIRDWNQYQRYGTFFGYLENGSCFSLGSVSCRDTLSHIRHGYFITGYGHTRPVTSHNFDLWKYFLTSPPKSHFVIEFYAGGERYKLVATETASTDFGVNNGTTEIFERFMTFTVNGLKGWGVGEYCASDAVPQFKPTVINSITILNDNIDLVPDSLCISISDRNCRHRAISGGKGAHLADLTMLSSSYKEINVPGACVVSTAAFKKFITSNEEIQKSIDGLREAVKAANQGDQDLRTVCEDLQSKINNGIIPKVVHSSIVSQLKIEFGENWADERLAVRSSSADEDSSGASSAGQMETYLGIKGEKEIIRCVKKCWASQYSYQSVVYRHKWGQPIDSNMAVVLMKMVPSELSGVLFTVNPLDGDATRMVVNSTFGLGESLVSGKCNPDNFVVEIDINGQLTIQYKEVGSKEIRIDMGDESTVLSHSEGHESGTFSLSDEEVLELGHIGILIQRCYGEPCDIEWAYSNGRFYIVQVRPITNLNIDTDTELVHEFDSALASEEECITTANIGEMMPMAVTPLTLSIFGSAVDRTMQTIPLLMGIYPRYLCPTRFLVNFSNHLFLNMHCLLVIPIRGEFLSDMRILFLALMGRVLDKPTREDICRFAGSESRWKRMRNSVISMKSRFQGTKKTMQWEKKFECGYKVPLKLTAKDQMEAITNQLDDCYRCWSDTVANTSQSAIWSMIIMKMLESGNGWTQTEYSQIAVLLSTCSDVYSADVPEALRKIAQAICRSAEAKSLFLRGSDEECLNWLHSAESGNIGEQYDSFLTRHGHRCIREAEFREKSWNTDQTKLISAVKPMVAQMKEENYSVKKELSVDEAIESIQLTMNPIKKLILKWIIKKARRGVGLREWGKSLSIKMCELFKQSFYHLGELMVTENLIPDSDLVNFFTTDELVSILVDKDESISNLIGRVLRRRKIFDIQMHTKMPEVSYGVPSEVCRTTIHLRSVEGGIKLSGLPVSTGEVSGVARVIRTIEEASDIKSGDILVVPYTDVGWTPYFPMLGGLVTEKGGLLSHGAVVAREYGLPCVVACVGATEVFQTGDYLLLNASRGTVETCSRL